MWSSGARNDIAVMPAVVCATASMVQFIVIINYDRYMRLGHHRNRLSTLSILPRLTLVGQADRLGRDRLPILGVLVSQESWVRLGRLALASL